jgi:hypothetical protein
MSPFAPPAIFRASAIALVGDDWVSDGVHLRVHVWPELGFPLHPFAAWQIPDSEESSGPVVLWTDQGGDQLSAPFWLDSEATGPVVGTVVAQGGALARPDWAWLELDGRGELWVELLDQALGPGGERVRATRGEAPWVFAGPGVARLRVHGRGEVRGMFGVHVDQLGVGEIEGRPAFMFGLPLEELPWHQWPPGADPGGAAKERLLLGHAVRLGPPDQPEGPFDRVDDEHDARRMFDRLGPELIDDWVRHALGHEETPPLGVEPTEIVAHGDGRRNLVRLRASDALLTMAADPRIARYLGLATTVPDLDPGSLEGRGIWVVATQWAVQPDRPVLGGRPLGAWLPAPGGFDPTGLLDEVFPGARWAKERLAELSGRLPDAERWEAVTLYTLAVATGQAPPDRPPQPQVAPEGPGTWNPGTGGERWTQVLGFTGQPPAGMVAFARTAPRPPVSLHRRYPEGEPDAEALALAPTAGPGGRPRLTDADVPADPDGAAWKVAQADEFGRWGEPAKLAADLPERPLPPPPAPEVLFEPAADDGSQGSRSPGVLVVRVFAPSAESLPAGAPLIDTVEIQVDGGAPVTRAAPSGDEPAVARMPAGATEVGGDRPVTVVARFRDADGRPSGDGTAVLVVHDPRAPRWVPTSPTLRFTARADPTGLAQLALRWAPVLGADDYRVYLGDERRLADQLGLVTDPAAPRAERVRAIWARADELGDKRLFTLLESAPVSAGGSVRFTHQIPGSLRGVQFVRVVPVSKGQVEARFDTCGLVPVAVPDDSRPPAPSLRVTVDGAGTAHAEITARGLDPAALAARPGAAPQWRLRRGRAPADPLYLPVVTDGELTAPSAGAADPGWSARRDLPAGPPFVRIAWLAEVRYPPEPARPAGTNPAEDDLGAHGLWEEATTGAPGEWSAPSLPASAIRVPPDPPDAPSGVHAETDEAGRTELTIPAAPPADPRAVGPYHAVVHRQTDERPLEPLPPAPITGAPFVLADEPAAGSPRPSAYLVALSDPLGRVGRPTRVVPVRVVTVPDLSGQDLDPATTTLTELGLVPVVDQGVAFFVGDIIVVDRLDPPPGRRVPVGTQVLVVPVGITPVPVPGVVGWKLDDAMRELRDKRLDPEVAEVALEDWDNVYVQSLDPPPATRVRPGTRVEVVPMNRYVVVPAVVGWDLDDAMRELRDKRLDPEVASVALADWDTAIVDSLDPPAGRSVLEGRRVLVWPIDRPQHAQ